MTNTTQQAFTQAKEKSLELLRKLECFLQKGENLGAQIPPHLTEKIANAIAQKQGEKLKVALIGGYSEGKTSIAGAWLGRKEKDMNISSAESTDAIAIYRPNDEIEIVDTPGLHGFKEKGIGTNAEQYKQITKKYISQAHLLLYVMNPHNPIKASHKEDLQWLFTELGLLDRTIFVLSKFDEMADIEDASEYERMFRTARDNVIQGLENAISLSEEQKQGLVILAVSANPFGNGLDYWLQHKEEFHALSRIGSLQEATKERITQLGGADIIATEAQKSVIADVLSTQMPALKQHNELIAKEMKELEESILVIRKDLDKITPRIGRARIALRDFAANYFTDLIMQLEGTSLETFGEFFERNIGSEGIVLNASIQNAFENEIGSVANELSVMETRFAQELQRADSNIAKYGKMGANALRKFVNPNNVKIARDVIVNIGSVVGLNLKEMLKFKPWGAVKFAKGANVALAVIGLGFELWDSYKRAEKENAFQKTKATMKNNLEQQRAEMLAMIDSESFIPQFFSGFVALQENFARIDEAKKELEAKQQDLLAWQKEGEIIDVEFRAITP